MRPRPVNHSEPGRCYVCGTGPGRFVDPAGLSLVEVTAGPRVWEYELCRACAPVGVALLARMFQDDEDAVDVEA